MSENQAKERVRELQADIQDKALPQTARLPGDNGRWTRRRAMPLEDMARRTLAKQGLSAVMEVRRYFRKTGAIENCVSKQAYLRQRKRLNPDVFKHLNRKYLKRYYHGDEAAAWHGYVVLAVDGSRVEVPDSEENRQIQEAKAHIPAVREITGERPVLLIFDRNYASMEFMEYLEKSGIKYLIRLHSGDYKHEREQMNGDDEEVQLEPTGSRLRLLRKENPQRAGELERAGPLKTRIVTMKFKGEEPGALATNLGGECGAEDIRRLYRKRWSIEEKYHTLKNKMKFESAAGNASIYVGQDFRAQTLVFNMAQDLMAAAEQKLKCEAKKKRYRYAMRINENIAIGLFKEQFVRLMVEADRGKQNLMFLRLEADMLRNIVPVRSSPSRPRRWQYFNKYKCNLKPSF